MYKHFVLFFLLLFPSIAFSQQILVSPASHDDFSLGNTKVIGQDENGYYILTSNLSLGVASDRIGFRNRRYKLGYFTTKLVRKWEKEVTVEGDEVPDAISFFNNEVMVVSSKFNNKESSVSYFVAFIDSSGKTRKHPEAVASLQNMRNDFEKCKVIVSSSREQFAIVTREHTNAEGSRIHAVIISGDLQSSAIKTGTVPYSEKTFEFTELVLSNSADLLLLGYNSEKIKALSSKRKTDYYVYVASAESQSFSEYNVSRDKVISGLGVAFDNVNRRAVMAGFYSEQKSFIGAGIYYSTLGMSSGDSVIIRTTSIDEHQNIRLRGERNRGAGIDLISYPIERIVPRQDGGAVIVAEAAYTTEYSFYDSFSQSFSRRLEYNFENVIIISINSNGAADWSSIIQKQQVSLDDGGVFSSFCSLLNSEQIALVYNEQISRRSKIIPVTVNNLGATTSLKPIVKPEGTLLLPRGGKQVSENEMIVPALIKRKLHFIKISF